MKALMAWIKTRDKQTKVYLAMFLAAGIILMLISGLPSLIPSTDLFSETGQESQTTQETTKGFDTERELEKRLEEAFAMIENVGRVRVLLSYTTDKETAYVKDANINESYSREVDGQGGSRETRNTQSQEKTVTITDKGGVDRPLVLRETEPKIAGVIIIAQGGDSVFVKDALTKAACTVLGIEVNKVQVLKMELKTNAE